MKRILRMKIAMVALGLLTIIPQSVTAQGSRLLTSSILMQDTDIGKSYIKLQFLHPEYKTYDWGSSYTQKIASKSGSYNLMGSFPMGENSAIQVTLPYHEMKETFRIEGFGGPISGKRSESGIGNIKLNLVKRVSKANAGWQRYTSVGVNLPTASEAVPEGALDNYYDIFSYLGEGVALHGSMLFVKRSENISLSIEFGPDFWIPVGKNSAKNEFLAHYGIGVAFTPMTNLSLRGEWVGLGIVSESVDFVCKWQHQLAIGARFQVGRLVPGFFWMKNMNVLDDVYESAIGFELGVDF